jgi:hypothetical protein
MAEKSPPRAWRKRLRGELKPAPFPFADAVILESPQRGIVEESTHGHVFCTSTWRSTRGAFRVDRNPDPHLAFCIGEHVCLGAHLARLELQLLFRKLIDRIERLEPARTVERLESSFISGITYLPVRMALKERARVLPVAPPAQPEVDLGGGRLLR